MSAAAGNRTRSIPEKAPLAPPWPKAREPPDTLRSCAKVNARSVALSAPNQPASLVEQRFNPL
eukprot:14816885-Alexandrium_andersonii.AAC.1